MSDTTDGTDIGHHAHQGALLEGLRRHMKEFVADRDRTVDVRSIRAEITEAGGVQREGYPRMTWPT